MLRYVCLLVTVFTAVSCSPAEIEQIEKTVSVNTFCEPGAKIDAAAFGGLDPLGRHLYASVTAATDGNVVFSPLSMAIAMGMLQTGARNETHDDLASFLGYAGESTEAINARFASLLESLRGITDVTLTLANGAWLDDQFTVHRDYAATLARDYGAMVTTADLPTEETKDLINLWADEQTEGLIPEFLKLPLPSETVFLLVNTIYFKGSWFTPFKASETIERPFHLAPGEEVSVNTMHNSFLSSYVKTEAFEAVRIPYAGNRMAMYVFLPATDVTPKVFQEAVTQSTWTRCKDADEGGKIKLSLPKFTYGSHFDLQPILKTKGQSRMFDEAQADFSGIPENSQTPVFVDFFQQAAEIIVNEEGTEAAAVTGIGGVGPVSLPPEIPFVVDRPFAFTIHDDETGRTVFFGWVRDPRSQ